MRSKLAAVAVLLAIVAVAADFQPALPGYKYGFPRDHFNHPEYQTEWWYYTGNLKAQDGHEFGFELTFFRQGVSREKSESKWDVQDVWMAHLALSDITGHKFYRMERVNRAGPGIAGVSEELGRIWNGNWQAEIRGDDQRLQAIGDEFEFRLNLESRKPPVVHGENGVSQKSAGMGNASHYISLTRLATSGTVELAGKRYEVGGWAWMDHEFFTHGLDASQVGWDWLSVQFADNTEVMLYRFRRKDGTEDPYSAGTFVDAAGRTTKLTAKDFVMTPRDTTWTSQQTKATYPVEWNVAIPRLSLELDITTPLRQQEIVSNGYGPSYWEGSIRVSGRRAGSPISAVGYLEMTGYDKAFQLGN